MSNFTLKEAFICAGALLLIAITAPLAIGNATNDAKLSACADKLRQVGAAQLSYAENNKSFLPMNEKNFIKGGGMARAATYSTGMPPMVLIMQGYFKKGAADGEKVVDTRERIFHCPADDVNFVRTPYLGWSNPVPPGISYFFCWFSTQKGLRSYSFPYKTKPDQDENFGLRANVERDDPGRFIYADLIRATSSSLLQKKPEAARANHNGMCNILYLGGHVQSKAVPQATEKFVAGGSNRFANFADDVD